ncbi:elongin-C-like isoform X2 [Schistocerca gregaria]|uniref:elongin-C-like isoform X2 n=1 Tax=Schistocerca gregaria TaxID=7010 RepID=UPI00211E6C3C|nr:elongin-C-like isoform X2 [Schistocerca gregaria]
MKVLRLISREGHIFILDEKIASYSRFISSALSSKGFVEGESRKITLMCISTETLEKCIQYFYYKERWEGSLCDVPEFQFNIESSLDLLAAASFLGA